MDCVGDGGDVGEVECEGEAGCLSARWELALGREEITYPTRPLPAPSSTLDTRKEMAVSAQRSELMCYTGRRCKEKPGAYKHCFSY